MKTVLYLLSTSPHTRTDRFPVLGTAREGDAVLLHQDGVLGLLPPSPFLEDLVRRGVRLVACEPDCRARGVPAPPDAVGWAEFVQLLEQYDLTVS